VKLQLIFQPWCATFGVFKGVAKKASSFPPLGLCYIAAIAEKNGWEVQIIDGELEGLSYDDILARIIAFKPDLIGLTATTPFFHSVVQMAKAIKEKFPVPIAVGGPHASLMKEQAFIDAFDYLFIGESENILPEFFTRFAAKKSLNGLLGVMYRDENGQAVFHGEASRVQNLDEIPWPARHLIPQDKYFIGTLHGLQNYTSFFISRGCPFDCVFCANKLYGKTVRRRSVAEVLRELAHIVNELKIKHIYFLDDTLTLDRNYIMALCQGIKDKGLKFTFEGSTRADLWDEDMVRLMQECGLIRISFGLETVDLRVRKIIKKTVPIESYFDANRLNNCLGIETINSVMLGLPGDTPESIKSTVDFLCKAKDLQHATYSIAMPYPGTEMWDMARQHQHGLKLVTEDFSQYQRYGYAVMEVNGMKPDELVVLQKHGLMRIYSCWWRVWPMIKRHGLKVLWSPAWDAAKTVFLKLFRKSSS
jgi:anaerobic magnesium-protoporphyrin IX monomethyl ester cyclase